MVKKEIKKSEKEKTLKELFGITKNIGDSLGGQEAKDMVRERWD